MDHSLEPRREASGLPARLSSPHHLQPADPAGTIYDRDERRRPHDRRQQRYPVVFDMRVNTSERRRQRRRAVYDPGRRRWPEPPLGIDVRA